MKEIYLWIFIFKDIIDISITCVEGLTILQFNMGEVFRLDKMPNIREQVRGKRLGDFMDFLRFLNHDHAARMLSLHLASFLLALSSILCI